MKLVCCFTIHLRQEKAKKAAISFEAKRVAAQEAAARLERLYKRHFQYHRAHQAIIDKFLDFSAGTSGRVTAWR
jgi:hypothetical protein